MTTFYSELIQPVELNTENPLFNGLIDVASVNNNSIDSNEFSTWSNVNYTIYNATLSDGGAYALQPTQQLQSDKVVDASQPFTCLVVGKTTTITGVKVAVSFSNFYMGIHTGKLVVSSSSWDTLAKTSVLTNNESFVVCAVRDATTLTGWNNGIKGTTTTSTPSGSGISNLMGYSQGQIEFLFSGEVSLYLCWDRVLTDQEVIDISADPYQLFKTQADVNQEYGLKLNTASQSISIPFTGATTGTITYTDGTTAPLSVTGTYTLDGTTPVFLAKITATDTNGFHYFEFNQTKLDTVTSHTSTLVCTLLGLPADSGYVRGANGQIEGYQFTTTTTATLTLTGAYTGLITYSDNTTLSINGTGNYIVNSGIVKSITTTDTVNSYNWDFTTGDSTKIIDTVSGNHAVITNASVDKWQPVIQKDVFTIKADGSGDYLDPTAAIAANNNNNSHKILQFYDLIVGDFIAPAYPNYTQTNLGVSFVAAKSKTPINKKPQVGLTGKYWFNTSNSTGGHYLIENLLVDNITINTVGSATIRGCYISPANVSTDSITHNRGTLLVENSFIVGGDDGVFGRDINNPQLTVVNNCIFSGCGRFGLIYSTGLNNVFNNVATNDSFYSNSTYSITSRSALTGVGNLVSQPVSTYFTDPANNDYTINTVGQAALKTKGWNGTDIVGWAYSIGGTPVPDIALQLLNLKLSPAAQAFIVNRYTNIGLTNVSVATSINLIDITTNTNLTLNNIKLNTAVSLATLNSSASVLLNLASISIPTKTAPVALNRYTTIDCKGVVVKTSLNALQTARMTHMALSSVGIKPNINLLGLNVNRLLHLLNIATISSTSKIDINRFTSVSLQNTELPISISGINITNNANLNFSGLKLDTYLNKIDLITGFMPTIEGSSVTLSSGSTKYTLATNTKYNLISNTSTYKAH